ncbi:ABC transporter ATP-binding protein [Microbacterium sp. 22242]|uniref:ABC transporter ATP-binding protein n=1 Tax=Microbacterium sp. 22242 TaxID=3453896 RepID=UPI003F8411C8
MSAVLRAEGATRVFASPSGDVTAVRAADLAVSAGELVVVTGRSGSGKTTLLTMLGGLDRPTSGRVLLDDRDLASGELGDVAGQRIASIFQTSGLLPVLSAAENIEVPLRIRRTPIAERERRVQAALDAVGLADHARQRPAELSGGQQQRVGIARALVMDPDVLIADEPTAQLDSETGAQIMDLIAALVHERGTAAVVATHDTAMLTRADRVFELHDGVLQELGPRARAAKAGSR